MTTKQYLFKSGELAAFLKKRTGEMQAQIDAWEANELLVTADQMLADKLEAQYQVEAPALQTERINIDPVAEEDIDVRNDPQRFVTDRSRPCIVRGSGAKFHLPFTGDAQLFRYTPSSRRCKDVQAEISNSELLISITGIDLKPDAVQAEFSTIVETIAFNLEHIVKDTAVFNNNLRDTALKRIAERKQKLLADRSLTERLGYPVRRREHAEATYAVPISRKRILTASATRSTALPFAPEPAVDAQIYEDILSILRNMAGFMERSPQTFAKLREDEIRNHFLLALNAQFEGNATGETFNFSGKTDILIRDNNKNLFIGECKFWDGEQGFLRTIDQILGYAQWRDCKLAILSFNRNKDFSGVLEKMNAAIPKHPNFRRMIPYGDQTCVRCALHHPDDDGREMALTVLAFEIPAPQPESDCPAGFGPKGTVDPR